ncbi:unnamed protein product [Chrysoparadoxa australica]
MSRPSSQKSLLFLALAAGLCSCSAFHSCGWQAPRESASRLAQRQREVVRLAPCRTSMQLLSRMENDYEDDDEPPPLTDADLDFLYDVEDPALYLDEGEDEDDMLARHAQGSPDEEGEDPRKTDGAKDYSKFGPPKPVKGSPGQGRKRDKSKMPVLAVIGRPNVGKSTVVNRIARTFREGSIVFDEEGVTRDRTYKRAYWGEYDFEVVDTGGLVFEDNPEEIFSSQIRAQAMIAMDEACAALLVTDGMVGVTALDEEIARFLRQQKVPVYLAVNKCESEVYGQSQAAEFWSLGLGNPFPVSGLHGYGVADLLDSVSEHLYRIEETDEPDDTVSVAIVGRPNVGKSSLLNRLFGEERSIVSDVAGTTRDTIDALVERGGRTYKLIDTAGIRKKKKVEYGNEFFMINRAFKAIRRSDVVLLVVDAEDGIREQDVKLAERVTADGRACVVVCNKWDAVEKDEKTYIKATEYVREKLSSVRWADIIFTSATTGQRCNKIFDMVDDAVVQHRKRVKTSVMNEVLRDAVLWQSPAARRNQAQGKIYYCNQVSSKPPTFAIFCNNPKLFSDNYRRYLERKFREQLGFKGAPMRFLWRGKRLRRILQEESKASKPKPYT